MVRYTAESRLRTPMVFASEMLRDLLGSMELAVQLFQRDVRSVYRQSLLGVAWLILPPLLTAMLWIFLHSQNVLGKFESTIPYPVYVLFGTTLWAFFSSAAQGPIAAIKANEQLITKAKFPIESIAIASLLRAIFFSTLQVIPLALVMIIYRVDITWTVVFVPVMALIIALLGFAIGWLLVPAGTLYGDFEKSLPFLLQFLMYLSPVIYVPPRSPTWDWIAVFNPLVALMTTSRDLAFGDALSYPMSSFVITLVLLGSIGVIWALVRLSLPFLVERMA